MFNNILNAKGTKTFVYNLLLQQCTVERAKSEQKWNNIFPSEEFNWTKNYTTPLLSTNDIKLREFQYKYLKRIIPCNNILNKCHLVSSALCLEIETLNDLFWECRHVQSFWMQLKDFLNTNGIVLEITLRSITFGFQTGLSVIWRLKIS